MLLPSTVPEQERSVEITLDEAINLLLKSIAMEERSLSKLLDVEREKVLEVLDRCRCGGGTLWDALEVNRSVDDILKTIAQLQMLLQFKLKNVQELRPRATPEPCSCLCAPCEGPGCSMMGKGRGCVCNCDDPYYDLPVSVYTFLPCGDRKNGTLRYLIGDSDLGLHLYACDRNVTLHCPAEGSRQIVVDGVGRLKVRDNQGGEQTGTASFTLTVEPGERGTLAFRMELSARGTLCLEHDSGWVKVDGQVSDLRIKICRKAKW